MHAVRTVVTERQRLIGRLVIHGTFGDVTGVTLQLRRRDVVVGIRVGGRPLRVGTAVAGLTEQTAVAGADPVEFRIAIRRRALRHHVLGEGIVNRDDRRGLGIVRAAEALGISTRTLYRKIEQYGLG